MKFIITGVKKNWPINSEICVRKPAATTHTTGTATTAAAIASTT